ncbi:MAG TPA: tetratricopeptide repeat protein [Pyrinomonadaceae bacterium]|nr:tetratricopeptide repeat protein [Pyrinomonadaceae bacterium]
MTDWLKLVAMIFYAPLRGMREVRDRAALGPLMLGAYASQVFYVFATQWLAGNKIFLMHPAAVASALFQTAASLLPIAIVLVPLIALVANLFDRRGSFGVVMQQEYASLASVAFYALIATNLAAVLIAVFFHFSGFQAANVASSIQQLPQTLAAARSLGIPPEVLAKLQVQLSDPVTISGGLFLMIKLTLFIGGTVATVRTVFRISIVRSIGIAVLSGGGALVLSQTLYGLFHTVLASPLMLLFLFFLLRGYFSEVVGQQRARAAFKQNLEAATINPRDSSAHYNLGLIHQQRGELDQARERFHRAIDIDADELDAHYQLGRIARVQNRLPDAVGHFEQVVQRDQSHALHEIWREIGSTYIAAGQYSDAREALERFLDRRPNDPEGLYLTGRAHAGLGDQEEAASSMQACIEAVKTAPAYKYRTEKRWLNEAQQFLKGRKREAVGSRQ